MSGLIRYLLLYHARIQRGSNFDNVFVLVDEGREDPKYHYKRAIIGPPAKLRFTGVLMMAQH